MYSIEDIKNLVENVIENNEPFQNEYEFQFALAMAIKENAVSKGNTDLKVKIEQKVYGKEENQENYRCDIVAYQNQEECLLLELKYVVTFGNQSDKTSMSSRTSFIGDIKRLYDLDKSGKYPNAEKYCVFVTNKQAVYQNKYKGNYFNDHYAKKELWTLKPFGIIPKEHKIDDVYYLIVNAKDKGADIPDGYKY